MRRHFTPPYLLSNFTNTQENYYIFYFTHQLIGSNQSVVGSHL